MFDASHMYISRMYKIGLKHDCFFWPVGIVN